MDETTELRAQVIAQCKAVSHMADVLARVHTDYAMMFGEGVMDNLLELVGKRTASFMEDLGEMLNGMDAVSEGDDWLKPIFHEAHRRWPVKPEAASQ